MKYLRALRGDPLSATILAMGLAVLALAALPSCSQAQVPPMLEAYKDADWEVEGDVLLWHNDDLDSVRFYQGGERAEGTIDSLTVVGCSWTGLFRPDTVGVMAEEAVKTASGYGEDSALQSYVHCIQLTASVKDSLDVQ